MVVGGEHKRQAEREAEDRAGAMGGGRGAAAVDAR